MSQRPAGVVLLGDLVGLFDLADDLRLAQHHAVQTRRHLEKVLHGRRSGLLQKIFDEFRFGDLVKIREEAGELGMSRRGSRRLLRRVDLNAIAGREDNGLGGGKSRPQFGIGVQHPVHGKGELLADVQTSSQVVAVNNLKVHRARFQNARCEVAQQSYGERVGWPTRPQKTVYRGWRSTSRP